MMNFKNKNVLRVTIGACVALILLVGATLGSLFLYSPNPEGQDVYIYIDNNDNVDSIRVKSNLGWRFDAYKAVLRYKVRTGRYCMSSKIKALTLYRKLRNGQQDAVNLTVPSVRTMNQLAGKLANQLMLDSAEIATQLNDSTFAAKYGYTTAALPALFIPNTYEVYWDITMDKLMTRMQKENNSFWSQDNRETLADSTGYSHEEIATLASILDEETANNTEKPMIAGMYLNRLRIGMPLQADPTVKFALQDFGLRRILYEHLKVQSPYNTYINIGLPPGPIRVASIASIDAVLHAVKHPYLYMCAKEDFSGTHNFAVTYGEHMKNARRYAAALNARNIK